MSRDCGVKARWRAAQSLADDLLTEGYSPEQVVKGALTVARRVAVAWWLVLCSRCRSSRPGLAAHVLRGGPLLYRVTIKDGVVCPDPDTRTAIVSCRFENTRGAS